MSGFKVQISTHNVNFNNLHYRKVLLIPKKFKIINKVYIYKKRKTQNCKNINFAHVDWT